MPEHDLEREAGDERWDRFVRTQSSPRAIPAQLLAPDRPDSWRKILIPRWRRVPIPLSVSLFLAAGAIAAWSWVAMHGAPPKSAGEMIVALAIFLGIAHVFALGWLSLRGPAIVCAIAAAAFLSWWMTPTATDLGSAQREILLMIATFASGLSLLSPLVIRVLQQPYWRWLGLLRRGRLVPAVVQAFHPASVADGQVRLWCMDIEFTIPHADVYGHLLADFPGWTADPEGLVREADGLKVRRGAEVEVLFDPEHPERFVVLPDSLTPTS